MAGDWIKMRSDLFTHPKVVRMSSALKADTLRTVGGLMSVWCLFDVHSVDGKLEGYTFGTIDDHLRWDGFSTAMGAVGWLEQTVDGLVLPRFDTHNGQSAKRRANDADRKREVRKVSASDADKTRTREEKRREEKKDRPALRLASVSDDSLFERFWDAYPKRMAKESAKKAFFKLKVDEPMLSEILSAVAQQSQSANWQKDAGQFIPHAATWLNAGRWNDELSEQPSGQNMFAGAI